MSELILPSVESGCVVTADQKKIAYDHYQGGNKNVVILAHGFYNSKQTVLFKDMGESLSVDYDVIVFDFRGHGRSSKPFYWTAKEHLDLEAVLNFASPMYEKIGVIGFSLGAATSIITAAKTDCITSLIAVSPPTQFNKIDFRFWELDVEENILYNTVGEGRIGKGVFPGPLWAKKTRPIDVVADIKIPILFIHGKKDWLIQPWHSKMLFKKATSPQKRMEIIKEGTHAEYLYRRDKEGTLKLFRDWFDRTLRYSDKEAL